MICNEYNANMKSVFLSDLHIQNKDDQSSLIFHKTLESPELSAADSLFLLGDIFDLCIGNHKQYIDKYDFFFKALKRLEDAGKKIYFIEGNHDFHLSDIFKSAKLNVEYLKKGKVFQFAGKSFFVCHGHEVDYYNIYFKRWYRIYSSKWFSFLVSYIFPFKLIEYLGAKASQDSKKRGQKTFNKDEMEKKYLIGAQALIKEKQLDGVICGHTHIKANIQFDDKTQYFNLGFPSKGKEFLFFDGENFRFISLSV